MKKFTIWTHDIDVDDWRNDLLAEYADELTDDAGNVDEYKLFNMAADINAEYLDDERANLDIPTHGEILAIAVLGLWNGTPTAYQIMRRKNVNSIFECGEDYNTWYIDERGDVAQDAIHHDGTNHTVYREFRPETTDGQRDALLLKIYNGTATRRDITRYTKTLGDRVANVYGWDIPALRRLNRNKKTAA